MCERQGHDNECTNSFDGKESYRLEAKKAMIAEREKAGDTGAKA